MIETVGTFIIKNARSRWKSILLTTHPYLSGVAALLSCFDPFSWGILLRVSQLAQVFATYDTVVFGFTAAAIALAIAIPNSTFLLFLSSRDSKRSTAYRDFIFILAWNGVVHIFAFLFLLPLLLFVDSLDLAKVDPYSVVRWSLFFVVWLQFYAVLQFLVTTLALFELSDLYAQFLAEIRARKIQQAMHEQNNKDNL